MIAQNPVIVTVTGPSGSGKTVLSHLLRDQGMKPLVSTTTRAPRQGEVDGVDYHFVTREFFFEELAKGKFMENIEYNGVLYGVSVKEAEDAFEKNIPAVLVAEPHGVQQIAKCSQERGWECFRVFVDNPTDVLAGRLLNRFLLDAGHKGFEDDEVLSFGSWISKVLQLAGSDQKEEIVNVLSEFLQSHGGGSSDATAQAQAAAKRLQSFYFEQEKWVKPALEEGQTLYDYITPAFNQNVQEGIVEDILNHVNHLQQTPEVRSKKGRQP